MKPADSGSLKRTLESSAQHEVWERAFRVPRSERFYEQVFDWLAAECGLPPQATVLDIGCGMGAHSARLARHGFRVVAADFSPDRVEAARAYLQPQHPEITVREEDLAAGLSFPPESFDGVLCWGVLMHIQENERAMAGLVRVTKPGGVIIVEESNLFSADCMLSLGAGLARRVVGNQQRKSIRFSAYGMEYLTRTPSGDLLVRHSRIPALVRYFRRQGCTLRRRACGQFTESFTRLGEGRLANGAHALNSAWFSAWKLPYLAVGNILIFTREPSS